MNKTSTIATLAAPFASALTIISAQAAISVVNADFSGVPDTGSPASPLESNPYTFSFDAGATADKLIVALSSELSGSGPTVIKYNDVALTPVTGTINGKAQGIFYLDAPFTGGAADLVIDMTGFNVVNCICFGVTSISGSAAGVDVASASAGLSTSLTPSVADSFVMSNYASNAGDVPTVPSGHTQLYTSGNIGSADGAAAYLNGVAAGPLTITYVQTGPSSNATAAAAFSPSAIPEPSSAALLALGGLALIRRRRH